MITRFDRSDKSSIGIATAFPLHIMCIAGILVTSACVPFLSRSQPVETQSPAGAMSGIASATSTPSLTRLPQIILATTTVAPNPTRSALPSLTATTQFSIPADSVIGTWEAQSPGNQYQMRVNWNTTTKQYEGVLTKQGKLSQDVGFSIGELCWIANPINDTRVMKEQQKWRYGANGVSSRFEWREGTVYLDKSTADTLITSQTTFRRVK